MSNLIQSVLLVVVAFVVKALFAAIGVELSVEDFGAIVAGIVTWLLSALGLNALHSAFQDTRFAFKKD